MTFLEIVEESTLEIFLAALVFLVFGALTVWVGFSMGGTRFLLVINGTKTTGQITRSVRDSINKNYRTFFCYTTEDGQTHEEHLLAFSAHKHRKLANKDTFTVYYNPLKPKQYFCPKYFLTNVMGLLCLVIGVALFAAAFALGVAVIKVVM